MAEPPVRYEATDGVATIILDRPDVLNAMNNPMRGELLEIFTRLRTDDAVKAVVVTGAGERAFCAGADIREFLEPPTPTHFREARKRLDFRAEMERCPQAIIAAIRGFALGGGLELALACDMRIAAEDAQLGLTEINLAIIPGGGGTQRLPRLVGRGKALEPAPQREAADGGDDRLRAGVLGRLRRSHLVLLARGISRGKLFWAFDAHPRQGGRVGVTSAPS